MPVTPVVKGKPVALVNVTDVGVPNTGVTNVGLVANTIPPEPVTFWPRAVCTPVPKDVMPVPPLAMFNVPAKVTAPDVAVFGVNPVVPAENVVTATLDNVFQVGAALGPPEVNTWPVVP